VIDSRAWQVRALSYGGIASLYEEARPTYPEELIDEIVEQLPGRRVAEVGAGTGKATRLLAARGINVACVEADPGMAQLLLRECAAYPGITVDVKPYESWSPGEPIQGLVCAQAWHWCDPGRRWAKAASVLAADGLIALMWNVEQWDSSPASEVLEPVFTRHGQEAKDDGGLSLDVWPTADVAARAGFRDLRVSTVDWAQKWTAEEFAAYRSTTSQVRILPEHVRTQLVDDIALSIRSELGGELTLPWRTYLFTAHRS